MTYRLAGLLLVVAACSHSDAKDTSKSAGSSTHRNARPDDDDATLSLDCATDIAASDIKALLSAPYKTLPYNADTDKNGCGFQAENFAAIRIYLVDADGAENDYSLLQSSGNVAPMAGVGDKALRGTSSFTKVVVVKGRGGCSIELSGVGNVASEAELVAMSQEAREQKLGAICTKLFAAKKL